MRFMFIVKLAEVGPPTPELMEAMNTLADREIKLDACSTWAA